MVIDDLLILFNSDALHIGVDMSIAVQFYLHFHPFHPNVVIIDFFIFLRRNWLWLDGWGPSWSIKRLAVEKNNVGFDFFSFLDIYHLRDEAKELDFMGDHHCFWLEFKLLLLRGVDNL